MEQEKYVVLENKKGIKYAVIKEQENSISLDDKVKKMENLIYLMMKQSIRETIKEYHYLIKEEINQQEEKMEYLFRENKEKEDKRWEELENHFQKIDRIIREKQKDGKRKKHSIF